MYVKHDRKCKMRFGIGIGDGKRDTRVCNSVKRCIYDTVKYKIR